MSEVYSYFVNKHLYSWALFKGVKRVKGTLCNQKLSITLDLLKGIFLRLDLTTPLDRTFLAACLVAFFSVFRKSNLLVESLSDFDPNRHLCVHDATFLPNGTILTIRWSKVIQVRERILHIPLPKIGNSPLCPYTALLSLVTSFGPVSNPTPLFSFSPIGLSPFTHPLIHQKLHHCLSSMGVNQTEYSGHSFRRRGASFPYSLVYQLTLLSSRVIGTVMDMNVTFTPFTHPLACGHRLQRHWERQQLQNLPSPVRN